MTKVIFDMSMSLDGYMTASGGGSCDGVHREIRLSGREALGPPLGGPNDGGRLPS